MRGPDFKPWQGLALLERASRPRGLPLHLLGETGNQGSWSEGGEIPEGFLKESEFKMNGLWACCGGAVGVAPLTWTHA